MNTNEKLSKLRELMKKKKINAIIIPTADPHLSEYLPERYKHREFITGFTGSSGTAVITQDKAKVWTDGRYFIQCANQIRDCEFEMCKWNTEGEETILSFLEKELKEGDKVEVTYQIYPRKEFVSLEESLSKSKIQLVDGKTVNEIWDTQPQIPKESVFLLEDSYAGESRREKLNRIEKELQEKNANATFISSLEDIAWILNLRGRDIPTNPVTVAYLLLIEDGGILFIHSSKISDEIKDILEEDGIVISDYDRVFQGLEGISGLDIYMDPDATSQKIYSILEENNRIIEGKNISSKMKAIKNATEIENQKRAYLEDGIALTKLMYRIKKNPLDFAGEFDVANQLFQLRKERETFIEESFTTISAVGKNAAMMHYSATEETQAPMKNTGMILIDSGGQYLLGTTDTTRTIILGEISQEEKHDFTLVLKSSIALLRAKFLKGTRDADLDSIARYPLWLEGKDYKCGTGHGVGYLSSVHESPPRFSFRNPNPTTLEEGHIVTIEPGIYREGKYGIRTENTVHVVPFRETEDGTFYGFENFTKVPIDLDGIEVEILTQEEKEFLNSYHRDVYETLESHLTEEEKNWLKEATKEI